MPSLKPLRQRWSVLCVSWLIEERWGMPVRPNERWGIAGGSAICENLRMKTLSSTLRRILAWQHLSRNCNQKEWPWISGE
jgi:hypothetical protein